MLYVSVQPLGKLLRRSEPAPDGTSEIEYVPLAAVVPTNVAPVALSVAVTVMPAPIGAPSPRESTAPLMVPVPEPLFPDPFFLGAVMQLVPIDTAPPASTMHSVITSFRRADPLPTSMNPPCV